MKRDRMNDRAHAAAHGATPHGATPHRPRTRAEERIEALDTSTAALSTELDELRGRAERAEQEAADNKAAWQRSAADFANYKRRSEQQREEELGLANEVLVLKLLGIADDLDRAIAHVPEDQASTPWVEGITAIERKLRSLLESEGVTAMPPAEGRPFDPYEQEAIAHEETSGVPDGTVLRELQRGYRIRERVLRPALVSVAKNEETTGPLTTHDTGHEPDPRE
jgi:molecular chaperone GrpE